MFGRSGHQVADKPASDPGREASRHAYVPRWLRRLGIGVFVAAILLLTAAALTKRPGDPELYPPPAGAPAVEVFVVSHGYHAGIVVPRAQAAEVAGANRDARVAAVTTRFAAYPWLEVGWGDEGFYTSVPTIGSLTIPLALRALFRPGNPSVVHVVGLAQPPRATFANADIVRLHLSEAGFARLLDRLDATFAEREEGGLGDPMGPGLYGPSLFYRGVGAFHLFNVCNHWIANLLDAAGVPTTPLLATLPAGLLYDLKRRAAAEPVMAP
jgi:uncharacterized protein (TIGR02117 family)